MLIMYFDRFPFESPLRLTWPSVWLNLNSLARRCVWLVHRQMVRPTDGWMSEDQKAQAKKKNQRERERKRADREFVYSVLTKPLRVINNDMYLQCLQPYILFQGLLFHSAGLPSSFPVILSGNKWRLPQVPKTRSVGRRQYQPISMNDWIYTNIINQR